MKNTEKIIDFTWGYVCPIIGLVTALAIIIAASFGTGMVLKYMDYSSTFKTPAAVYEIGEIVEDEYQIVGTDNKNTLWLQKRDEDCTYVAIVSSDYPNLTSISEKFKWLWNTSLKDSVNIEIKDQVESPSDTDKS